jgi:hypothetical protein
MYNIDKFYKLLENVCIINKQCHIQAFVVRLVKQSPKTNRSSLFGELVASSGDNLCTILYTFRDRIGQASCKETTAFK